MIATVKRRAWSGGAVRNALLGMPIAEIDVATTAVPEEVIKRVTAAGFKHVPTGIEHGTVTVIIDKHPFEVTTLRKDVETYGRHAKVAFGGDWKADAERRDFTINALSATRDGTVLRLYRRPRRSRPPPRALHRRSGQAHRRRLSAYPALLPFPRGLWHAAITQIPPALLPVFKAATDSTSSRASGCGWR